jgi:hypothetical protein
VFPHCECLCLAIHVGDKVNCTCVKLERTKWYHGSRVRTYSSVLVVRTRSQPKNTFTVYVLQYVHVCPHQHILEYDDVCTVPSVPALVLASYTDNARLFPPCTSLTECLSFRDTYRVVVLR